METKYCPKCDKDKPLSEWSWKVKAKKILADQCKMCLRLNAKAHYQKNKQQYVDRAVKRHRAIMKWYSDLKRELGCFICNENEPCAIDHHHLHGKDFVVSNYIKRISMDKVIKELNKGIFLCSNCHRKHHAGLLDLPVDIEPLNIESMNLTALVA